MKELTFPIQAYRLLCRKGNYGFKIEAYEFKITSQKDELNFMGEYGKSIFCLPPRHAVSCGPWEANRFEIYYDLLSLEQAIKHMVNTYCLSYYEDIQANHRKMSEAIKILTECQSQLTTQESCFNQLNNLQVPGVKELYEAQTSKS